MWPRISGGSGGFGIVIFAEIKCPLCACLAPFHFALWPAFCPIRYRVLGEENWIAYDETYIVLTTAG
jgi:hypothetical protein